MGRLQRSSRTPSSLGEAVEAAVEEVEEVVEQVVKTVVLVELGGSLTVTISSPPHDASPSRFLAAAPNCEARKRASLIETHGRPERSSERVAPSSSARGSGW